MFMSCSVDRHHRQKISVIHHDEIKARIRSSIRDTKASSIECSLLDLSFELTWLRVMTMLWRPN